MAAALRRRACAAAEAAQRALDGYPADAIPPQLVAERHELTEVLRAAAAQSAPGWLGTPLDARPLPEVGAGHGATGFVRVGTAQPHDEVGFPAIVPLLGAANLA